MKQDPKPSTIDMFGDSSSDERRAERIEIQRRQRETRGGIAQTGDLPLFSTQTDIFFQEQEK